MSSGGKTRRTKFTSSHRPSGERKVSGRFLDANRLQEELAHHGCTPEQIEQGLGELKDHDKESARINCGRLIDRPCCQFWRKGHRIVGRDSSAACFRGSTNPLEGASLSLRVLNPSLRKVELWRRFTNIAACPAATAKQKTARSIAAITVNKLRGMPRRRDYCQCGHANCASPIPMERVLFRYQLTEAIFLSPGEVTIHCTSAEQLYQQVELLAKALQEHSDDLWKRVEPGCCRGVRSRAKFLPVRISEKCLTRSSRLSLPQSSQAAAQAGDGSEPCLFACCSTHFSKPGERPRRYRTAKTTSSGMRSGPGDDSFELR